LKIKGLQSTEPWDVTEQRSYSLEEIRELLKGGNHSVFLVVSRYTIKGILFFGTGLTLWDESHAPRMKDGKVVISTYFRRIELGRVGGQGDPEDPIRVEVEIEPSQPCSLAVKQVHAAR